jgi:type II secretory pathway pseudopilin PulG
LERRRKRLVREPGAQARSRDRRDVSRASTDVTAPETNSNIVTRLIISPVRAARRVPFAVVVVGLLLAGLALTLWLSTKSAQDSYQLGVAREQNEQLSDRRDALMKAYESGDSAPELSDKAGRLGMIPATDVPRLVVGTDGRSTVIGEIKPAEGAKAPSLNDTPRAITPSTAPTSPTSPAPAPGAQGTPVTGTTTDQQTAAPGPTSTQNPATPAAPPAFTNVLPTAGGAPGANSGQTR